MYTKPGNAYDSFNSIQAPFAFKTERFSDTLRYNAWAIPGTLAPMIL